MRDSGVGIFFFRKPVLLNLRFAINEPLPRGYTVISCAFLMRFGHNLPNKWPKNGLFLRIKKSQTQYMVGARVILFLLMRLKIDRGLNRERERQRQRQRERERERG